jgi:poly-beta-1,6-N-acetyl-D-glucosamine synthase
MIAEKSLPQNQPIASEAFLDYVLITPARNEAAFIEGTLQSVISQTVIPLKWVIVSDGSTDGTDEIVKKYLPAHSWIELVRMPEHGERDFAAKVRAFNAGYARVQELNYKVIGNLDADITFDKSYVDFLLSKFRENPQLGVVGTPFREGNQQYDYRFTSSEHVSGACQLFRRECFEAVGGYIPTTIGGVDLVAVITARMKGWQTRSFSEKHCVHHRNMGTAKQSELMTAFKGGRGDYMLGAHPVWQLFRSPYQMTRRPIFIGGCLRLLGYFWAMFARVEKSMCEELVRFRRQEQMRRLKKFFANVFTGMSAR